MWTTAEKDALVKLYPSHTDAELCEMLGKTKGQIRGMKSTLGLNSKWRPFDEYEKKRIIDFYKEHPDEMDLDTFCITIGRPKTSVSRFARSLGLTNISRTMTDNTLSKLKESQKNLRDSDYYREKVVPNIKKSLCLWHSAHEHPRGMLGVHHTDDTKRRMSASQKIVWANKTPDERAAFAERIRNWHVNHGHTSDENTYSRCRRGKRADLGNVFFRSGWEANVARIFVLSGIRWDYEPRRFRFADEGDDILSYCPDFYLPDLDIWVEVKGWMDEKSIRRLEKFMDYYPEQYEKLVLIDEKKYRMLESRLSSKISTWEYKRKKKEN